MKELDSHDVFWIKRRIPRPLLDLMLSQNAKLVLAGGFIRDCIANEPINDIDVFTGSKEGARQIASDLAAAKGWQRLETDNAFTVLGGQWPVQFIHRWSFDAPAKCVESFDFTIARAAVWFGDLKDDDRHTILSSTCDDRFYCDLAAKRLVYCCPERNEDAGGSMLRVLKFYQRGYRIPLDSLGAVMARMAKDYNEVAYPDGMTREQHMAFVFTGMLREVDPNVDPEHLMHLPAIGAV